MIGEKLFLVRRGSVRDGKNLTIIVSKRVARTAVLRNRIRRRLRVIFHNFSTDAMPLTITALPSIVRKPFAEIKMSAEYAMKKL